MSQGKLNDLVVPESCSNGHIKWFNPNNNYLRMLFEHDKNKCKKPLGVQFQVCVQIVNEFVSLNEVWDVTYGIHNRKKINLTTGILVKKF